MKRNFRKTKFSIFTPALEEESRKRHEARILAGDENKMTIEKFEQELDELYEDTEDILDDVAPVTNPSLHIPGLKWYTNEHKKLSQEIRRMKRYVDKRAQLLKKHGDPTFHIVPDGNLGT